MSRSSLAAFFALLVSTGAAAQFSSTATMLQPVDIPPNAGSFEEIRVGCPAGYAVLSGGLDTTSFDDVEMTTSAPTFAGGTLVDQPDGPRTAGDGWMVRAINYGPVSRHVVASAVCAPVSDVIVSIATASFADFGGKGVLLGLIDCFDGYFATGGGAETPQPQSMKLVASEPRLGNDFMIALATGSHAAPTGWHVGVVNQAGTAGHAKVAAVCVRAPGISLQVLSPASEISFGTQQSAALECPAGNIAAGGGIGHSSIDSLIMTASTPVFAGLSRATARAAGRHPAPTGWLGDLFSHAPSGSVHFAAGAICIPVGATAPGSSVTVYEFYNTNLKHFFRTSSATEATAIDGGSAGPGWQRTGDNFVALAPGFGDVGNDVCRFYTFGANSHFYTAFADECEGLKSPASGWVYESLAYRIELPAGNSCREGTVPVHRLYNNRFMFNDSNHRFTTLVANIAPLEAQGWIYEGVAFCAANFSAG